MSESHPNPQFKLRMTPEIKAAIERAAALNNRSINAEILARLEASFLTGAVHDVDPADVETLDILDELEELKSKVAKLRKNR